MAVMKWQSGELCKNLLAIFGMIQREIMSAVCAEITETY
jgi:hypothetical protein